MSQYPHGYGQYTGHPPQYPYPYQPPQSYPPPGLMTPYPPPVYSTPAEPQASGAHYGMAQNAFNANASNIPGLGIVGTPNSGSPYNAAGMAPPGWDQSYTSSSISAGAPGTTAIPPAPPTTSFHQQPQTTFPPLQHPAPTSSRLPNPIELQNQSNSGGIDEDDDMEEGELSEGQFADLYEPRDSDSRGMKAAPMRKNPSNNDPSRGASVADTPEAGFYTTEDEGATTAKTKDGVGEGVSPRVSDRASQELSNQGRDRSGSYSPYLSPREIESDRTPNDGAPSPQAQYPLQDTDTSQVIDNQTVPGPQHSATFDTPPADDQGMQVAFRSLDEARKEAQKAILRLWPLGVKYQHYIEEGFDETVVKSLFEALHLDINTGRPTDSQPRDIVAPALPSKPQGQVTPKSNSPPADKQIPTQQPKPSTMDKSEERKDRIARLLAAKAAKPAPSQAVPPAAATPSANSAPAGAPKTKKEKELLLRQKMEALRKSREARTQKSTSENNSSTLKPSSDGVPVSAAAQPGPSRPTSTPIEGAQSDASGSSLAKDVSSGGSPQEPSSIPGLFPSALRPAEPPTTHRKRPVAMDFIDYPSTTGSVKRPFGQERNISSLVIDVSDASDEDMDIDMDEDSPTEPSSGFQRAADGSVRRALSMRDFPPLTDTSKRQYSSPAPSSNTPPANVAGGKKRESELEKAIQDMRRKIAEAEAKRKAKKSSAGSQTPNASNLTPSEPKDSEIPRPPVRPASAAGNSQAPHGPSAQLLSEAVPAAMPPKPSGGGSKDVVQAERGSPISNLDLTHIDGNLQEKIARLKYLQAEQAKLQAEIDASLAEKRKSASETIEPATEQTPVESSEEDGQITDDAPRASLPTTETGSPVKTSASSGEEAGEVHNSPPVEDSDAQLMPSTRDQSQPLLDIAKVLDPQAQSADGDGMLLDAPPQATAPQTPLDSEQAIPGASAESVPPLGVEPDNEHANLGTVMAEPALTEIPRAETETAADGYEPPDSMEHDAETSMSTKSSSFSPAPAPENTQHILQDATGDLPLPTQISTAGQPHEVVQEMETKIPSGEIETTSPSTSESTFRPYESPLRNFRAYRFHRDFRSTVAGGLKSLTYSHRIDPNKEFCPFDLRGQPCPNGESCQFQHLRSITVPDDQILLELGRSDDYTGDQKNRFIQGLRELLQNFRANKIRDFETIANGIIEFRSGFLGDKSKVLQLEGIAI